MQSVSKVAGEKDPPATTRGVRHGFILQPGLAASSVVYSTSLRFAYALQGTSHVDRTGGPSGVCMSAPPFGEEDLRDDYGMYVRCGARAQ